MPTLMPACGVRYPIFIRRCAAPAWVPKTQVRHYRMATGDETRFHSGARPRDLQVVLPSTTISFCSACFPPRSAPHISSERAPPVRACRQPARTMTWAQVLVDGVAAEPPGILLSGDRRSAHIRFQQRFERATRPDPADQDILQFVFGRADVPLDQLPQRTTLERGVVAHLRAGRHRQIGAGWLPL